MDMVWPCYLDLVGLLAMNDYDDIEDLNQGAHFISKMKKIGREYMFKNQKDFEPSFHHMAMSFLNPAMKKLRKVNNSERNALKIILG